MHVEKNVCNSVIDMFFNIQGKTKDSLNTRQDLVEMGASSSLSYFVQKREDKFLLVSVTCESVTRILFK